MTVSFGLAKIAKPLFMLIQLIVPLFSLININATEPEDGWYYDIIQVEYKNTTYYYRGFEMGEMVEGSDSIYVYREDTTISIKEFAITALSDPSIEFAQVYRRYRRLSLSTYCSNCEIDLHWHILSDTVSSSMKEDIIRYGRFTYLTSYPSYSPHLPTAFANDELEWLERIEMISYGHATSEDSLSDYGFYGPKGAYPQSIISKIKSWVTDRSITTMAEHNDLVNRIYKEYDIIVMLTDNSF